MSQIVLLSLSNLVNTTSSMAFSTEGLEVYCFNVVSTSCRLWSSLMMTVRSLVLDFWKRHFLLAGMKYFQGECVRL